jgi:transcriptional regulator with XRE-family HTH domain
MEEIIYEKYQKNFGQYVREHRERKGYTQQKLAELLKVTPKSISYIERGENYPSVDNMFELAHILDMSIDEFIFSYKKFDTTLSFEELNECLRNLSHDNQIVLLSVIRAVAQTLTLQNESKQ